MIVKLIVKRGLTPVGRFGQDAAAKSGHLRVSGRDSGAGGNFSKLFLAGDGAY
jgi:hypothetical protein